MSTFLQELAQRLYTQHGKDISQLSIVFPTRRARLFFREALAQTYNQTIWSPRLLAIEDYVQEVHQAFFPDSLQLLYDLYEVYLKCIRKTIPEYYESFENFYPWGEVLLKDFDEIDKYLVDAQKLYSNIEALKDVDNWALENMQIDDELRLRIEQFIGSVFAKKQKGKDVLSARFIEFWGVMYEVYSSFRTHLQQKDWAYNGMAYREIATKLVQETDGTSYEKVIFASFNALSRSEEVIMESLLKLNAAEVYWDVDASYMENHSEAGKFIREYHAKWKQWQSHLIMSYMEDEPKDIYFVALPQHSSIARYAGKILAENEAKEKTEWRKTAAVLADEQLLFPLLYALPDSLSDINLTMGYPLRQTTVYQLISGIFRLVKTYQETKEEAKRTFHYQAVLDILSNPFIRSLDAKLYPNIYRLITENRMNWIPESFLDTEKMPELVQHIFRFPTGQQDAMQWYNNLLETMLNAAEQANLTLEAEYIFSFYKAFQQLRTLLIQFGIQTDMERFSLLLKESLQRQRIPFEGEPLNGLQILGFLETRVLDFEHLLILGANEGSLPETSSGNSFIPLLYREIFRLPTHKEKDAIYAYHFFRLIQRAKTVHLVYRTEGNHEKSRFIRLLEYKYAEHPNIKLHTVRISPQAHLMSIEPVSVQQTEETRQRIRELFCMQGETEPISTLSPSAINTWIKCPLQFYFKYVASLKAPEALSDSIDEGDLGNIFHAAMHKLYLPNLGEEMTSTLLDTYKTQVEEVVELSFAENGFDKEGEHIGKTALYKDVIIQLCKGILEQEYERLPFKVEFVEFKTRGFAQKVQVGEDIFLLNGTFDRVDKVKDTRVIIDYKTGNLTERDIKISDKSGNRPEWQVFFEEKGGHGEILQGLLYAYLLYRKYPRDSVKMGFYLAKRASKGIIYLEDLYLQADELLSFELYLKEVLERMLNSDFSPTPKIENCKYCQFTGICQREREKEED